MSEFINLLITANFIFSLDFSNVSTKIPIIRAKNTQRAYLTIPMVSFLKRAPLIMKINITGKK